MKNFKKAMFVLTIAVMFLFVGISDVFAKGGSRSSSSRSSGFSRPSSPSKSSPTKSASTKPASSTRSVAPPKRTSAQQKSYETAKQNGTAFKSKSEATSAFKTANASKYTSTYKTQPATRPAHIPQTTSVGGTNYNVTYNSSYGGYGYMGPSGSWMMYNAMSDAIMLNALMSQDHYYYDTTPAGVVHHRSVGSVLVGIIACLIVVIIFIVIFSKI